MLVFFFLVQQLRVKIMPFMIKQWNLAHLQYVSFKTYLEKEPLQNIHVSNMAAFFKKGHVLLL